MDAFAASTISLALSSSPTISVKAGKGNLETEIAQHDSQTSYFPINERNSRNKACQPDARCDEGLTLIGKGTDSIYIFIKSIKQEYCLNNHIVDPINIEFDLCSAIAVPQTQLSFLQECFTFGNGVALIQGIESGFEGVKCNEFYNFAEAIEVGD
nr:hypothetical protein Iba_chr02aCG18170 [Ipomoea batatas]